MPRYDDYRASQFSACAYAANLRFLVLIFSWVENEGCTTLMRDNFRGGLLTWWRRETQPLLPVAWLIWTPAIAVIYSLPVGLQFPADTLIQCFWSLALVVLTDKNQTAQMATEPA